jgi:hypothetical protein
MPVGKRLLQGMCRRSSGGSSERRELYRRSLCRSSGCALLSVVRFRCRGNVVVGAPSASERAGLAVLTRVLSNAANATLMAFVACLKLLALCCRGCSRAGSSAFGPALPSRTTRTRVGRAVMYERGHRLSVQPHARSSVAVLRGGWRASKVLSAMFRCHVA